MAIRTLFKRIILLTAAVLLCIGLGVGTFGNYSHKSYLAALIIAILMAAFLAWIVKRHHDVLTVLDRFRPATVCVAVTALCLLLNGVWVLCFRPVQAPDYQTFYEAAVNLSQDNKLVNQDYIAMFPHILGYAAFLGIFLRVFGQNILTAALLNVVLTGASAILIYILTLRWTGKRSAAAIIGFFWAVCPSKLLYNTMALSEPYYTFLMLLFLLLSSLTLDCGQHSDSRERGEKAISFVLRAVVLGLLGGFVLALMNSARPIGPIPIIALLIWILLLRKSNCRKPRSMRYVVYALALIITYAFASRAWNAYAATKLGQTPPSVPGYSIYVGFNPETQGSYSDRDMELLQGRYFGEYGRNADAAQRSMLESAKARIWETKSSIPGLMIHKLGTLLGHDEGGAFYSLASFSGRNYALWCAVSNIWYYFVCILALAGGARLWRQERDDSLWMVPLCLIGVILAQLLVEVAARYHYCLIPLLLLLAGLTIDSTKNRAEKPG